MAETITFDSNGTEASGYLALPEAGTGPGVIVIQEWWGLDSGCLLYTSPSPRDLSTSRMPSSA